MKPLLQKSSCLVLLLLLLAGSSGRLFGQVAANVTVGPGGTYTSFTNAGGLFAAINSSGMNQNVTATVIGNITETGANNLNEFASPRTLTIRPNSATERVITITAQDTLFVFRGTDRVTIDGSFNGSGRFLRFVGNNSTRANTQSLFFLYDGASNLEFKNCIFESNTENNNNGIFLIGAPSSTQANENITIQGNIFRGVTGSFFVNALRSTGFNANRPKNLNIVNNDFTRFSFAGTAGSSPVILIEALENSRIDSNRFYAPDTATAFTQGVDIIDIDQNSARYSSKVSINYNSFGGFNANRSGAFFYIKTPSFNVPFTMVRVRFDSLPGNEVRGNRVGNIGANNRPEYRNGVNFLSSNGSVDVYENIIGGKQNAWDTVTNGYDNGWITVNSNNYANPDTIRVYNNLISDSRYNKGNNDRHIGIYVPISTGNKHVRVYNNTIKNLFGNSSVNSSSFCLVGIRVAQNITSTASVKVYNNVISNLQSNKDNTANLNNVGQLTVGIISGSYPDAEYYNNRIFNIGTRSDRALDTGTNVPTIVGMLIASADPNFRVYNNQISLSSNSRSICQGISVTTGAFSSPKIYNNSIYIAGNAPSSLPSERSACITVSSAYGIKAFNNILYNNRGNNAPSFSIDIKNSTRLGDTSFQNNLFINPTTTMAYWPEAGNTEQTLSSWRALRNFDTASTSFTISQLPVAGFFTHADTANFSIVTAARSNVLGKGIAVDGVDEDVNGNVRSNPPSIGAHEYAAVSSSNITVTGTLNGYTTCEGDTSAQQSFTVAGTGLSGNISITAPTGFEVSTTSGTGFATSLTLTPASGAVATTTIYARISSSATGNPSGNIVVASTGATTRNVAVTGTVRPKPSITLGTINSITTSATSFAIPYTTTGSVTGYSVTAGTPNAMPGFTTKTGPLLFSPLTVPIPASAVNTYNFKIEIYNNFGCVSPSVPFTVTVTPAGVSNNTISSNQTVCANVTPAQITGSTPTGGIGTYTYTWLSSTTDSSTGFSPAAGTNNAMNYTPGKLSQRTWFRRYVVSGTSSDSGNAISITVRDTPSITLGTVSPITNTATSFTLPYSGTSGSVTGYSITAGTPTAMPGFTTKTGPVQFGSILVPIPASLVNTYNFNIEVYNVFSCGSGNIPFTVTVTAPIGISNNTIGTDQIFCSVSKRDSIFGSVPTGGTGAYTYQWLASSSSATSGYGTVSSSNTRSLFPQGNTGNTWYRRIVTSGTFQDTSAAVKVTINRVSNDTIYGPNEVCTGTNSLPLRAGINTSSGVTAYTWLRSTTDSISGFSLAPGTNNQVTYSPGLVNQTAWYKVVAASGSCLDTTKVFGQRASASPKNIIPGFSGMTSPQGGPSTQVAFQRGFSIYPASEMQDVLSNGDSISKIGWIVSAVGGTFTQAVSGNLKIYLVNTSDATMQRASGAASWNTITSTPSAMTLCYNGTYTLPTTTGAYYVTLQNKFAYTGQGVYLAFEWSNSSPTAPNTYLVYPFNLNQMNGTFNGTSSSALPATLNGTILRPRVVFGKECEVPSSASLATVLTSGATSVGLSSATLGGNVTANGGANVTERGVVYSTTANPTTASGTKIAMGSGNGSFSQIVIGLNASTTYHVRAYAINSEGTSYGADSTFTTLTPTLPLISVSGTLDTFATCQGTASTQQSITVSGSNLFGNITVTPPSGYEVSTTSGSGFSSSVSLTRTAGAVSATTVYVRLTGASSGTPNGNITFSSPDAFDTTLSVTGTVNALPTITLGSVSSVLTNATSFSLPYSATTGTPNQYSITAGSPTAMSGFTAVSNVSLGSSPISVTIPASAANTYNFNLTVRNSTTGCVSANVPFTLTVNTPGGILNNTISTAQTICSGSIPAALSGSTPTGGIGTFTYTWLRSTTSAGSGFTAAVGTNNTINYNPPALNQNTWFRRLVVSGSSFDTSAAVLITVTNSISNNTIANPIANAVCLGDFTPDMDGSTPSGGDGTTYSYQWLKSTTSASAGFTAISGANAKSYFPPVLSQTTWFRRIVSSGQCAADTSAAKGITVNPKPTITLGTISSVNTLATSFSIPYSATTGTPTQYSIATGSPTAMPGFTPVSNASLGTSPISVSIPASAANTYNFNFTVRNTSTGCVSAVVPIALTVTPGSLPIGNNTIGSAQTICSGTAPAQLTGSTPTGGNDTFTYTWLKSTTNAVNGFTAIPSSNTVNYTSPALTQTTWFRRYVVSGAHSDTSAAIKITVGDTIRPVVVARNLTVYLNASGNASITAAQADSASADNCGIQSRALSTSSFTCANLGSNTVRLLVTDLAGNKDSANFTVLVMDTVKPVVITQNRTVYLNASGNANVTATQINNGSSDACGIASVSLNTTSFTCSNVGANTVTLTVTDVNGNVQTGTATVTVLDTIKPTVNVQSGLVLYLNANGTASVASSMINNGSTDNCGIASVTISPTTINCAHLGITPVTLTVTDVNGNSASGVSNVVVLDPVAPVARPKARLNLYLSGNGQAVINPALLDSASSDNCTLTSRVLSQSVFNCSNIGTNNVTFTVQDQSGNSHAAIVQVTVIDTIAPVATVSNQLVYLNNAGTATITAAMVNNNSTDNCGIQSVSISKSTFTCSDLGTSTINFTVTDVNGNFKTAPVVINVFDTIRPVMRPKKNVLVYLNALGTANLSLSAVDSASSDNCNLATRTLSKTQFGCADLGVNTLTLTGTDSTGNIGSAQFSLTVLDTIRPVLNTRSATLYVDGSGNAVLNPSDVILSGTDNCSAAPLAGLSKSNFNCSNLGGNTVSVTLTDASGNFRTASASVTVLDTIKPTAIGQNRTIYLNASGTASITAAQVNNGSTDNCSVQSLSISKTNFTAADLGANLVTLTVTDQSSNSAQTQVLITVLDTIKPIVTTQNRTIYLNASGVATIAASQINNGSTDNVSISAVQLSKTLFTCSDLGNNQVVLTVIDGSNNSQTGTATVTVVDTIKPIVNTQNITLYLNGIGQATLTPAQANNGSSDNCGVSNLNLSKTLFTCADRGNNTIQLQVTDASNNSSSGSLQVTVLDTIRPNVVVNNNLTLYLNNAGIATLTNAMVGNGSTDNCGITSQTLSKTSFNGTNLGLNLVNYTIADASGNTNSVILNITVVDTIRPVVSVQNRTIYLDGSGTATLTPAMVNNGSSDNVGITLQQLSKTSFNCNNLGANQVLYTLEDASANQMSALVTITVLDTIKPTASARNLTVYLNAAGTASITPAQANNGSSDNCSTASLALSKSEFGCADLGPNAVVLTVNDGSNNASTASFTVTVLDTIRPSLLVNPMVMLYLDSNGQASLSTDQVNLSSFDNCSALSFSLSKTSFNGLNLGMNQVIFTATDGSNNVRTANISVNVIDTVRPRIRAKNLTLHLGNGGFVFLSPAEVDNGSTDNVGVSFSALSKTIFNCNETGTNLVEYFIQDISGNRSSTWVTVTVLDTMMPVVTSFPESVILGHCNTDFQFSIPTATDNCSQVTIKQTTGIGNGKKYPVGVTTNTFTFTDRSGNLVTRSFTVTILPPYLPDTFPNITVCSSNPPFDLTRGNANVVFSGSGVSLDGKQFDPGLSGPGNHAVVCTFTDSMGCETKANFFVTVHRSPDKPMIERMNSDVLQVTQSFDFYQWRRNYEDIPGANQRAYTMTKTGIYSVRVGTVQGCTTESDPVGVGVALGIGSLEDGLSFNLFPNPTQERFRVDVNNLRGNEGFAVQVFDGVGRLVYSAQESAFSHSVETGDWSPGTYFVHIKSGDEKAIKPVIIAK